LKGKNDLLPFYTILRSIPDKLGGVIAMFSAILILLALPILDRSRIRSNAFRPINKFFFWLFVVNIFLLGWIGGNHAEEPFITIGQICTVYYFGYFLIIIPLISEIENRLSDLATFSR
jgi:ubiquinol-cytochrome c reductase cytochrome b subunit